MSDQTKIPIQQIRLWLENQEIVVFNRRVVSDLLSHYDEIMGLTRRKTIKESNIPCSICGSNGHGEFSYGPYCEMHRPPE